MKFYLDKEIIPKDGSLELLQKLKSNWSQSTQMSIFPDVHLKENAPVTNGLLTVTENAILTDMLGVANCGFSLAELHNWESGEGAISLDEYLKENLGIYVSKTPINRDIVKTKLANIFKKLLEDDEYKFTFKYLGLSSEDALNFIENSIKKIGWEAIENSFNCLGSGNHFLEIHRSSTDIDKVYILLHTDSIGVGMKTLQMYEPLANIKHVNLIFRFVRKLRILLRKIQFHGSEGIRGLLQALYLVDIQKSKQINIQTDLGRKLISDFLFAELVGFLNRSQITDCLCRGISAEASCREVSSVSHDSVLISNIDGSKIQVVQRNGVQNLANKVGIIPSHAGGLALLVSGKADGAASGNINHGTGKLANNYQLQQINFQASHDSEVKLINLNPNKRIQLTNEQFKDINIIQEQITTFELADVIDTLQPIIIVKG